MNLRFRVLKQPFNILPSAYSCATAGTVADKADIGLKIYVNGSLLLDAPIGTLTDMTTDTDTVEGITSTFAVEDTDYFVVNIDLSEVRLAAPVRLIVYGGESHYDYDTAFTVFGFDLGNNPNIVYPPVPAFIPNPDMDITLAPRVFTGDGVVTNNKPCSKFTNYRNPITQQIHVLLLTSAPGDYDYFVAGAKVASGKYATITDSDGVVTTIKSTGKNSTATDDVSTDVPASAPKGVNATIGSMSIITPGICDEACDCIQDTAQVKVLFDYSVYGVFTQNDLYVYAPALSFLLTWELVEAATGIMIDTTAEVIVVDPTISGLPVAKTYNLPVDAEFDRVYYLTARLTQGSNTIDEEVMSLVPCNMKEVSQTDCGAFTFTNKGEEAVVRVKKVEDDGTHTEIQVAIVPLGGSFDFTLTDGVYIIEVSRLSVVVNNYKVFSHCAFSRCFLAFAENLVCKDPCAGGDCGCGCSEGTSTAGNKTSTYTFSAFMSLALTYLNLVNENYATGYIANEITDEINTQLTDTAKVLTRLSDYCDGCSNC